jgi:hypothetical protein
MQTLNLPVYDNTNHMAGQTNNAAMLISLQQDFKIDYRISQA